jgi:hypothetical protein
VELLREELRLLQEIQSIRKETHPEGTGAAEAASAPNAPNVVEPTPPPAAKAPPAITHDKAKDKELQGKDKDNKKAAAAKAPPVLQATAKKKAAESLARSAPKAPKKSKQMPRGPPPKGGC